MRRSRILLLILSITLNLVSFTPPAAALALTVVDRCQSDTEPGGTRNLAKALTEGGHITFNCPPGTEIRMTTGHIVAANTIIEGDYKVTLDAHGLAMTMFKVPNGTFSVERLTIRNVALPRSNPAPGFLALVSRSSVLYASDDVSFTNVSIIASESPVMIGGNANIIGSKFTDNTGVALSIDGEASIERSRFIGNEGGLSLKSGLVHDSIFSKNTSGALHIRYPKGKVSVVRSNFLENVGGGAIQLSQRSGREGIATVSIKRSRFADNINTDGGGAITIFDTTATAPPVARPLLSRFPPARFEFAYNQFINNHGNDGGAILAGLYDTAGLQITGGIFIHNVAHSGGAIAWEGHSILINHSLFRANQAQEGGALFADFHEAGSHWIVANSLFAENTTVGNTGIIHVGPVELFNVTIARNTGIGLVADVRGSPPDLPLVVNTIISENSEGNCRGIAPSGFKGNNLQYGHQDCPGVPVEDPLLDSLYVPLLGSPALSLGDVTYCRAPPVSRKDIIFQSRATGSKCALGAFEQPPIRRVPLNSER